MTNENAIVPAQQTGITLPNVPGIGTIESIRELARMAALSGMAKTKDPYDAFFIAMYGWELGIPPMTALRTIYKAGDGVPTCSGEALLALIRKSGKVRVTVPDPSKVTDSATVTFERLDSGDKQSFMFTKDMADKAGLKGTAWTKYQSNMLIWRAVSMGAKLMCSDITGGMMTVEEISPHTEVNEAGTPVGDFIEGEIVSPEEAESKRRIALLGEIHRNINTLIGADVQTSEIKRLAGLDEWSLDDIKAKHPEHSSTEKFAKLVADRWANEQPKAKPSNGNGKQIAADALAEAAAPDVPSEAAEDTDPKASPTPNSTTQTENTQNVLSNKNSTTENGNTKPVSNGNGGARIGGTKPDFAPSAEMKLTPNLPQDTICVRSYETSEKIIDGKPKPYLKLAGNVCAPNTDGDETYGEVARVTLWSLVDFEDIELEEFAGGVELGEIGKGKFPQPLYVVATRNGLKHGADSFDYVPGTLSLSRAIAEAAASRDEGVPF